jgi:transcription termination factor Rho
VNKSELQSKHISELHSLAADAGVERFRMLTRDELIDALADGDSGAGAPSQQPRPSGGGRAQSGGGRAPSGGGRAQSGGGRGDRGSRGRRERGGRERGRSRPAAADSEPSPEPRQADRAPAADSGQEERPRRRRRRRRFGRRGRKTIRIQDALLPAEPGRQALVYGETRSACTALLRELAAELSGGKGPDPVALLVDPSPEELAEWKREAPKAEIVSAGQERHAEDALEQAARRAASGEAVIFLIDSLSRVAEEFGGAKVAKDLFDSGLSAGAGGGSLTVVAALERADD